MQNNPYNLKQVDEIPAGYLDADEFVNFLNKNKIIIKRKDNLPRLAYNNSISMLLVTTSSQIKAMLDGMKNNNNSLLGREILKKKKAKILEIFDKAEDQEESRTSIAEKVANSLGVNCNRKLVRSVLESKRSSKLEKLKKIS